MAIEHSGGDKNFEYSVLSILLLSYGMAIPLLFTNRKIRMVFVIILLLAMFLLYFFVRPADGT
jgi:hypothetical protein